MIAPKVLDTLAQTLLAGLKRQPNDEDNEYIRSRTGTPGSIGKWCEPQRLNPNGSLADDAPSK